MIDYDNIHSAAQLAALMEQERRDRIMKEHRDNLLRSLPHGNPSENQSVASQSQLQLKKGAIVHTAFDTYTLTKQIGQGGNGRVFSAISSDNRQVAIKFVDRNCGTEKLKRFKNEVHFCEIHTHKNIVPILDRGYISLDKEYAFYVMPLYAQTLKDKISQGLKADEAVSIFVGILEGLRYAHQYQTIHRDIKPENILFLEGSMVPVICDFGIAHFAQEELLTAVETKMASRMANFQYCAPEQKMKGGKIGFQTDLYAAALILNEMFTREIPQGIDYPRIADINSEYAYLDPVVEELLRQHPEDRLYPEDKIISEMKLRAEQQRRTEETEKLRKIQNQLIQPEKFEAHIVGKEYRDGCIQFIFDRDLNAEWTQLIKYGSFSHSAIMGYEKERLKEYRYRNNQMGLPIHGDEAPATISTLISHMNDWVAKTNELYQRQQESIAEQELAEKEKARKAEIEKWERENRIADILSQL